MPDSTATSSKLLLIMIGGMMVVILLVTLFFTLGQPEVSTDQVQTAPMDQTPPESLLDTQDSTD